MYYPYTDVQYSMLFYYCTVVYINIVVSYSYVQYSKGGRSEIGPCRRATDAECTSAPSRRSAPDMERPRSIATTFAATCFCLSLCAMALLARSHFSAVRTAYLRINRWGADNRMQRDPAGLFGRLEAQEKVRLPQRGGCLWDIGAHDGVYTSNSFFLINYRHFKAWLFEPSPRNFVHLLDRYGKQPKKLSNERENVELFHMAIGPDSRLAKIRTYTGGTENTIVSSKHDQFDSVPKNSFWLQTTDAKLICEQLLKAFSRGDCQASFTDSVKTQHQEQKQFAFLTIDTEGLDMNILHRLNRTGCLNRFDLLFAESVNRRQVEDMGFRLVAREHFVAVYARQWKKRLP